MKKTKIEDPLKIKINEDIINTNTDPLKIANSFNEYFAKVGTTTAQNIPN